MSQTIPPFITMLLLASRFSDSTESLSDLNPYIVFSPMYAQELILAVGMMRIFVLEVVS